MADDGEEAQVRVQQLLQVLSNSGHLAEDHVGGLVSAFVLICEVVGPDAETDPAIVSFADVNSRLSTSAGLLTLAKATLIKNWTAQMDEDDD